MYFIDRKDFFIMPQHVDVCFDTSDAMFHWLTETLLST